MFFGNSLEVLGFHGILRDHRNSLKTGIIEIPGYGIFKRFLEMIWDYMGFFEIIWDLLGLFGILFLVLWNLEGFHGILENFRGFLDY